MLSYVAMYCGFPCLYHDDFFSSTMMIIDTSIHQTKPSVYDINHIEFCLATITSFCSQNKRGICIHVYTEQYCIYLFVSFSSIHLSRCCSVDVVAHVLSLSGILSNIMVLPGKTAEHTALCFVS